MGFRPVNAYRLSFLTFCLEESIAPEMFAAMIQQQADFVDEFGYQFYQMIMSDWSLCYVFRACEPTLLQQVAAA